MRFSPLEPQFTSAYFVSFEQSLSEKPSRRYGQPMKNFEFFFITDTFLEMATVFFRMWETIRSSP